MPIDNKQFIHPEDRAALEKLEAVPGLDKAIRTVLEKVIEDYMHGVNLAEKVRLSRTQMPTIYRQLEEVCEGLELPVPELYLKMDPGLNAYTAGDTNPFIVINSGLIELLEPEEIKFVIAHECGHILCNHVRYLTLAQFLTAVGDGIGDIFRLGLRVSASLLQSRLMAWVRSSEFSADRVSAYVMKNADVPVRTMMRLSSGSRVVASEINMEEYLCQADEYGKFIKEADKKEAEKNKFLQNLQKWMIKGVSNPFPAIRVAEIVKWFNQSQKLIPGIAPKEDVLSSSLNW